MAIQIQPYIADGTTRTFPQTKYIPNKNLCRVFGKNKITDEYELINSGLYDVINNAIVFTEPLSVSKYSAIEVRVADNEDELGDSLSDVAIVASIYQDISIVADISEDVTTVANNIEEVLLADTNAQIATVKALEASNSASEAFISANNASASEGVSIAQASIATTQANLATNTYDQFDDRYLGSKTFDPNTDNDGNTLVVGCIYWNSDYKQMRAWSGTVWIPVSSGSGASGGGVDKVFYENDSVVTTSYSLTVGKNAMSAGEITINDGVEITIPNGSSWVIV
jgi:hypothetical protein